MIPILYEKDEVHFQHNGLGQLPNVIDSFSHEAGNGFYELQLTYPTVKEIDGYDNVIWKELKLVERQILYKPSHSRKPHAFRIYDYDIDALDQTITIYARSRAYDLAGNVVQKLSVNNATPQQAMNQMKNNLTEPTDFDFYSDMSTTSSTTWEQQSGLSTIMGEEGSLIQYWGGEVLRENTRISLYNRIGKDNVTTLRIGKNIEELNYNLKTDGMVTAIIPFYRYTPEGEDREEVIVNGNTVKSSKFNNYRLPYYQFVEYTKEDGVTDVATLNKKAASWFKEHPGADEPNLTVTVAMTDVAESTEYSDILRKLETVNVFDTVSVYLNEFDIDMVIKVNSLKYDGVSERNLEVELGTPSSSLFEAVVGNQFESVNKQLDEVRKIGIIAQISADGKNTNYQGSLDPNEAGLVGDNGDIYFRTIGTEKQMWQYQGDQWNLILDTSRLEAVEKEVSAIIAQADADREAAEQNFEQAVTDATAYTNTKAQEFDNQLLIVNQDLGNTKQVAESALNKSDQAILDAGFAKVDAASAIDSAASALTKVNNLSTDVTNVRTDLNGNITALNQLKTDVDGYQVTLADHTGKISIIENNVNGLQTTVADKADETKVTQLSNQWTQTTNLVNGHTAQISNLGEQINLRVTSGQVTEAILADKKIKDTRNDNQNPYWYITNYPQQEVREFKNRTVMGVPGNSTYVQVTTKVPWAGGTSGGVPVQVAESNDGTYQRVSSSTAGSWLAWDKIAEAGELVTQINLSTEGVLIQGKRIQLDGDVAMNAAFINRLDTQTLTAVTANIATIRGQILIANVVDSTHIKSDTALITKLFATDANVNILTAKTAFINSVKAVTISADKVTTGTLNAANVNLINVNVSSLVGNISEFVRSNWNGLNTSLSIESTGLITQSGVLRTVLNAGQLVNTSGTKTGTVNALGMQIYDSANGQTTKLYSDGIEFNWYGVVRGIEQHSEGLAIKASTGSGSRLNSALHLITGAGNDKIAYLQLANPDGGTNSRLEMNGTQLSLRHPNGGSLDIADYNYNGLLGRINAGKFRTTTTDGRGIQMEVSQISALAGNQTIYIMPSGTGELRIGNGSANPTLWPVRASQFIQGSSRASKTNIRPYTESAVALLNQLKVVSYNRLDDLARGVIQDTVGFIAEDSPAISVQGAGMPAGVDNYRMVTLAIKGVQELSVTTNDLEIRVKAVEEENRMLKQKLQQLESAA